MGRVRAWPGRPPSAVAALLLAALLFVAPAGGARALPAPSNGSRSNGLLPRVLLGHGRRAGRRNFPAEPPENEPVVPDVEVKQSLDDEAAAHPLGTPLGDVVLPQPETPGRPPPSAGSNGVAAGSPEGDKAPSATDVSEQLGTEDMAARLAETVANEDARAVNRIREIRAPSCPDVCRLCILEDSLPGVLQGRCHCFADCELGADSQKCAQPAVPGWSDSDPTRPEQEWSANCGGGDRDCRRECVDEEFLKHVDRCMEDAIPADCLNRLKALYDPLVRERTGLNYCAREHLDHCEHFGTLPANESQDWYCWATEKECEEGRQTTLFREMEIVGEDHSRDHLSVWHSLRAGKFMR